MKDLVSKKLEYLRGYVEQLEDVEDTTVEELRADEMRRAATERFFHLAIETVLDIASVLVADAAAERPDEYKALLHKLGDIGVLDPGFADRFARAAGFRNILVHKYADIDVEKLHAAFDYIDDFDRFARSVATYVQDAPAE